MTKECKQCGKKENLQLAHILSERLARIIMWRQFSKLSKSGKSTVIKNDVYALKARIRRCKGDLWLCPEHHKISDDEQKVMEKLLMVEGVRFRRKS